MCAALAYFVCFDRDKACIEHCWVDAKNDAPPLIYFEVLWVYLVGNVEHVRKNRKNKSVNIMQYKHNSVLQDDRIRRFGFGAGPCIVNLNGT